MKENIKLVDAKVEEAKTREQTISITPTMLNAMVGNIKLAKIISDEWEYERSIGTKNITGNDLYKRAGALLRQKEFDLL